MSNQFGHCCKCYHRFQVNHINLIKHSYKDYLDTYCCICLEDFTEKKPPHTISFCKSDKHPMHRKCILQSFNNNNLKCPVCRATFPVREV